MLDFILSMTARVAAAGIIFVMGLIWKSNIYPILSKFWKKDLMKVEGEWFVFYKVSKKNITSLIDSLKMSDADQKITIRQQGANITAIAHIYRWADGSRAG